MVSRYLLAEGIRSHCAVPLMSRNRSFGTLNVGRLEENAFTPVEIDLLAQVAAQIALAVENALAFRQIEELKNKLAGEKLYLEDEIRTEYRFTEIVGESLAIKNVLRQVEIAAPADTTVLIQGETGTGKELIARALHILSSRKERTFVKLNCAAIPSGLLESELFGHEKGAFTERGMHESRPVRAWPTAARFFSMKSATFRWRLPAQAAPRPAGRGNSNASAPCAPCGSMFGSLLPPTETWPK